MPAAVALALLVGLYKLRPSQPVSVGPEGSKKLQASSFLLALAAAQSAVSAAGSAVGLADAAAGGGGGGGGPAIGPTWADNMPDYSAQSADDATKFAGMSCLESGYCSLGKLPEPYVGEVDSTEGLRAALKSAAYKKEVFLIMMGEGLMGAGGGCCGPSEGEGLVKA